MRRLAAGMVALVAAAGAGACTDDPGAADGSTTTAAPIATIGRATAAEVPLTVGQCGDVPRVVPGTPIDPATFVPGDCQLPHLVEVAAVLEFPASPAIDFPGSSVVDGYAADRCLDEFEPFVGAPFEASRYDMTFVAPGPAGWAAGDRRIACIVYDADFATLTGPARNSGL
jgi:hypothetical protein